MILQANPKASYLAHQTEIDQAIKRVLDSGWYILGKEVETFEHEFARYCETAYSVAVASGTDALVLALRALNIGLGDEVITCGHTATATIAAIEITGASPVLVDIEPSSYTLSPQAVEKAITPHTKAIIAVHLYGHPANMEELQLISFEHEIPLIEDCAQAHGALYNGQRVGSLGIMGCFSFYPTKNLGAFGDGGAIVTQEKELHKRLLTLRQYGWQQRYISSEPGYNSRLDELQAAILRIKLYYLEENNKKRHEIADVYDKLLASAPVTIPTLQDNISHVYHQYVIQVDEREMLMAKLKERGIGTAIHYPQANHLQPAYINRLRTIPEGLPNLVAITPRIMSLPMYPELTLEKVHTVAKTIAELTN